jgi:AraC-like DNA-binding protein
MGRVAALLSDSQRRERLRAALEERHELVAASSWPEFVAACERAPIVAGVIDLHDYAQPTFDALRQFRQRHGSAPMILYVATPPVAVEDVFEAGRFGFDAIIVAGRGDEPKAVQEILERAMARGVGELVRPIVTAAAPVARDAALAVVARAYEHLTPESLARLLGVRRRALTDRLSEAGMPPPQKLIAWGRMIMAARLLEDRDRKVDAIALTLDFPSGSAFRNACQRYLGCAPHKVRERGGAAYVIQRFASELTSGNGANGQ